MYFHPNTTKIRITATFRNTMKPLKIELPSVPRIRKILISTTISAAGIFTIPPSQGQAASAWGNIYPHSFQKINEISAPADTDGSSGNSIFQY